MAPVKRSCTRPCRLSSIALEPVIIICPSSPVRSRSRPREKINQIGLSGQEPSYPGFPEETWTSRRQALRHRPLTPHSQIVTSRIQSTPFPRTRDSTCHLATPSCMNLCHTSIKLCNLGCRRPTREITCTMEPPWDLV